MLACETTREHCIDTRYQALARFGIALLSGSAFLAVCYFSFASSLSYLSIRDPYLATSTNISTISLYETLGVASRIYVISLPRRKDRRRVFDTFRTALGLRWTYFDAMESTDPIVSRIMDHVRTQRSPTSIANGVAGFRWPENINALATSEDEIEPAGSDLWTCLKSTSKSGPHLDNSSTVTFPRGSSQSQPLTCALEDDNIPAYRHGLSDYQLLTAAKVACWHSHLSVIRLAANSPRLGVTLVLEDDVDMEQDIHERLAQLWRGVPPGWDIVFLGHCWSNESYYPAMARTPDVSSTSSSHRIHALHPSNSPRCTHAYLLSSEGARRLYLHLRHPPFAYSRAVDQALAWLVRSGRLRAYSVVPSLVVQRKLALSDVSAGRGSDWREELERGILANALAVEDSSHPGLVE